MLEKQRIVSPLLSSALCGPYSSQHRISIHMNNNWPNIHIKNNIQERKRKIVYYTLSKGNIYKKRKKKHSENERKKNKDEKLMKKILNSRKKKRNKQKRTRLKRRKKKSKNKAQCTTHSRSLRMHQAHRVNAMCLYGIVFSSCCNVWVQCNKKEATKTCNTSTGDDVQSTTRER